MKGRCLMQCPACGGRKIWKDGIRYLSKGQVQRFLCRSCGYRFSDPMVKLNVLRQLSETPNAGAKLTHPGVGSRNLVVEKGFSDSSFSGCENVGSHGTPIIGKKLYVLHSNSRNRRVCASDGEAKNLVEVESRSEKRAAGATTTKPSIAEVKGKIIEFAWWLKKQGYRETTVRNAAKRLALLSKRGANLLDTESVKETIAVQQWAEATKLNASKIYSLFLKMEGLTWEPPIYKAVHKIPFIPTEKEIDALIAACGPKLSTFLQLAKETGARSGELQNLKWIDLDVERRTVRITAEKSGSPRILRISPKCLGMLLALPKKSERIFGNVGYNSLRTGFGHQRKKIARKLNNPRLKEIHFHTLRHWKATMLYHQIKDVLYVMKYLGHKKVESTLLYIQLEQVLFKDASDEFTVRIATKPDEIKELLEAGFEFVCQKDELMYFRKRK